MNASTAHWAIRALTLVALLVSAYLTWTSFQPVDIACTGASDCDDVLASKWSRWFNIPVSLLGLLAYATLFGCSWFLAVDEFEPRRSRIVWIIVLAMGFTAAASGIWFIALQAVAIGSFCVYCLTIHMCGFACAVLLLLNLPSAGESDDFSHMSAMLGVPASGASMGGLVDDEEQVLVRSDYYISAAVAVAGLLMLTIGQAVSSEPESEMVVMETRKEIVEHPDADAAGDSDASSSDGSSTEEDTATIGIGEQDNGDATEGGGETSDSSQGEDAEAEEEKPKKRKKHRRFRGKSRTVEFIPINESFDVYEMPLIGDHKAPHVIMEFIDYTCPKCRKMHVMLKECRLQISTDRLPS